MPGSRGSCDAGFGDAAYVVEITRIKSKETATFRLCTMHADNLRLADRTAQAFEIRTFGQRLRNCGPVADEPEYDEED